MSSNLPVVAFNAHLASGAASYRSAGISGYIGKLLSHLPLTKDLRYAIFLNNASLAAELSQPVYTSRWNTSHPLTRIWWEQAILPLELRRRHAQLLHAPAFVGPLLSACPQVVTVHDLSFLRHPEFFRRGNRGYLRWMTRLTCRRAAAVIAVSHFTAQEVTRLLSVPAARVHTIYHGVDPRFRPLPAEEVTRFRQQKGLPERFILYLGTLEPRKNLLSLVRACALLDEPQTQLFLAGGRGWLYAEIFAEVERLGLQDRVHFPGYIPDKELVLWYNAAWVFAYVSLYEGFGLPILEALACGLPVLAGNTTSLPEAAGNGALLVSPTAPAEIAAGLRRLWHEKPLREQLRHAGLAHAARFTWEQTGKYTAALYRRLIAAT
ncbi:MAG: glycosyltransferase family 1 protein [Chloroflexota bacterium]|nr:glycosyltransferase family 1 protein [Chloroflexota bacterium]